MEHCSIWSIELYVLCKSVDCILNLQSDVFFNTVHQKQII